jgi:predicted dehydrogenase
MSGFTFPEPHIEKLISDQPLRWGIIGPGGIASTFANALHTHTNQRVVAVASRSMERAEAFAAQYGIEHSLDSYEQLVSHPDVDAVYVATTHELHDAHAMLAISAGKNVLVEKPFALTAERARIVSDAAASAGVLAMEALWTTYIPQSSIIRQMLSAGDLGDIDMVISEFGQDLRHVPRLVSPIAGGALLDLGIYNFAFTSSVLGHAQDITTTGSLTTTGVDETTTSLLSFASGAQAVISTSLRAYTPTAASITGSTHRLNIHEPFFVPSGLSLYPCEFGPAPMATWTDTTGVPAHEGLCYQAAAFASHVAQGITDSPLRPLSQVVADISLIDQARHQIGAFLTGENAA